MSKLFHGSNLIIKHPDLRSAKVHNDFGQGFYCTEDANLAAEWACKNNRSGYVNTYDFDVSDLKVLDLMDGDYSVLNWITLLIENRIFDKSSELGAEICNYLTDNYSLDISSYDVIIGYRADDSYFSYADSWLDSSLSLESLSSALYLGRLGEQIVLKSEKAFKKLKFISASSAEKNIYYPKFIARDTEARNKYKDIISEGAAGSGGIFALDIIRRKVKPNDPCLQQFILKRCEK